MFCYLKEQEPKKEYNGVESIFGYQPPLPGDCNVERFILDNVTPYDGDESFLADPTERTLKALAKLSQLLEEERERGGVWSVDTEIPSTITSHAPGYLLSESEDIIKGLQTDSALKRSCKPRGGFKVVEKALKDYGYEPSASMKETYTQDVKTHNDYVFSMYTAKMRKARHTHLITGLPDAYGRGRLIGDYRRIALYGIDDLIQRKKYDFEAIPWSSLNSMRLRGEISSQIQALENTLKMADKYGVDLRKPASNFKEAVQAMWFGLLAALKEEDGAATSAGRWDAFLDIYAERDLKSGLVTESDLQVNFILFSNSI
jgi:formate C-acetyltransferase